MASSTLWPPVCSLLVNQLIRRLAFLFFLEGSLASVVVVVVVFGILYFFYKATFLFYINKRLCQKLRVECNEVIKGMLGAMCIWSIIIISSYISYILRKSSPHNSDGINVVSLYSFSGKSYFEDKKDNKLIAIVVFFFFSFFFSNE